jgi:hypothetical protein
MLPYGRAPLVRWELIARRDDSQERDKVRSDCEWPVGTKMFGNVMLWYQEVDACIRLGANRRSYLKSSLFDMDKMVDQKTIQRNRLRSQRTDQYIPTPRDN